MVGGVVVVTGPEKNDRYHHLGVAPVYCIALHKCSEFEVEAL